MTPAAPTPRHPSDITSNWLQTVLTASGSTVAVDDIDVAPIGTGQTGATYRITAHYGSSQHDLPTTFVIKLPAGDDSVRDGVALGYLSEVAFYTRAAHRTKVPIPRCFYSDITDDGSAFALLLADLAPAVPGDQITGCDPEAARQAVTALAGLHGPSWCDPRWLDMPHVVMPKPGDTDAAAGLGEVATMAAGLVLDKFGDHMEPSDRDTLTSALQLVSPWLQARSERYALMHGDYRLDNLMFDPDSGEVRVVDWQTIGVGLPARDLAYFVATSMAPDIRSAHESDLVGTYHRALLEHGVTDYSRQSCWDDYRFGMLHAPLIIALATAFAAQTPRGEKIFLVMLHRSCRAIRELGTLELLAEPS